MPLLQHLLPLHLQLLPKLARHAKATALLIQPLLLLQASMLPLCQQQRLLLQDARPAQPSSMRRCLQLRTLLLQAFQQLQQLPQGHLSLPPWTACQY